MFETGTLQDTVALLLPTLASLEQIILCVQKRVPFASYYPSIIPYLSILCQAFFLPHGQHTRHGMSYTRHTHSLFHLSKYLFPHSPITPHYYTISSQLKYLHFTKQPGNPTTLYHKTCSRPSFAQLNTIHNLGS